MEKNYVSHLECSITGKKYEANKIHGLSDAGRPLLVRYDLKTLKKEFSRNDISNSHVVISHGGAGTIFQCLQNNKIPIIIPRLSNYDEHINEFYDEVNDVQDDLIERARDEISNKQGEE